MSDTTDPTTGFITRSGGDAWGTTEPAPQAEQAAAPVEPAPTFGDVGQGVGLQQDTRHPLDLSRLNDHAYWTQNKAQILAAFAAGELPGQPNSTNPA